MKKVFIVILFLGLCSPVFGDHLISVDKALKKIFKKAETFEAVKISLSAEQIESVEERARVKINGMHSSELIKYTAKDADGVIGFGYEDTVFGKWGPIHYLVGLNTEGIVQKVIVLDYDEIRGKPVAKNRFLKQYKKKSVKNPVRLQRDIDGITGATISSRSMTSGVRKILHIHALLN